MVIDSFSGKYSFLSNFYACEIYYANCMFKSVEAAYQAAKIDSTEVKKSAIIKRIFSYLSPAEAKALGSVVPLRPDWESYKESVMLYLLRRKFNEKDLRKWLLETGDAELIEGNYWHDNTWGDCRCVKCEGTSGKNLLGKFLMQIRGELKEQGKEDPNAEN